MKESSVISESIFMNSKKIQNLFGPHPSHILVLLSLPPSSRFRIWISGSQTLQCPLTPRLSQPLFFSLPLFLSPLLSPLYSCLFHSYLHALISWVLPYVLHIFASWSRSPPPHTHTHLPHLFGNFLSSTGHITPCSFTLQPPYVFQHVCMYVCRHNMCVFVLQCQVWFFPSAFAVSDLRSDHMLVLSLCHHMCLETPFSMITCGVSAHLCVGPFE